MPLIPLTVKPVAGLIQCMINPYQPAAILTDDDACRPDGENAGNEDQVVPVDAWQADVSSILTQSLTWKSRLLLIYTGILVPIGAHLTSMSGMHDAPDWQTDRLGDKLNFILSSEAGIVFYPLLMIAIGCFAYYLITEGAQPSRFAVRTVIYGGALIAAFYTFVMWIVLARSVQQWLMTVAIQFGIPFVVLGLPLLARQLRFRVPRQVTLAIGAILTLAIVVGLIVEPEGTMEATISIAILASLFCGPAWALLAYGFVAMRMIHDPRTPPKTNRFDWVAGLAYLIGIAAAIPASVQLSLNKYSTLPTTPPPGNCYVVTAAARGHRRWVASWDDTDESGSVVLNRQLCRLRMLERWLQKRWPHAHRGLRRVYDRIGPIMAARISNPWIADLAYVSLKPIEWISILVLNNAKRV